MLKTCSIGEVGRDVGLVGRDGTGDFHGAMLGVELRARRRWLTVENIA